MSVQTNGKGESPHNVSGTAGLYDLPTGNEGSGERRYRDFFNGLPEVPKNLVTQNATIATDKKLPTVGKKACFNADLLQALAENDDFGVDVELEDVTEVMVEKWLKETSE